MSWRLAVLGLLIAIVTAPVLWKVSMSSASPFRHWSEARWDSAGLAPDPATTREAVVQVYAARAWGWKGVFAVHTWLIMKREGAVRYDRYEVVGWGVRHGRPAVRKDMREVDGYWAGNPPRILVDRRGPEVGALIERIEAAIATYPIPTSTGPGRGPTPTPSPPMSRAACPARRSSCRRPRSARIFSPTAICSRRPRAVPAISCRCSVCWPVARPRRGPGDELPGPDARHRSARRGDQAAGGRPHRPVLGRRRSFTTVMPGP